MSAAFMVYRPETETRCKQEKISLYGIVCGQGGIQPDPNNISAVKQMSAATGCQKLHTFLILDHAN